MTEQQVWLPDHHGQLSSVETVTADKTGVVIPLRRVG
jgi:hypothetical protein